MIQTKSAFLWRGKLDKLGDFRGGVRGSYSGGKGQKEVCD
jgi:hypothetical protein